MGSGVGQAVATPFGLASQSYAGAAASNAAEAKYEQDLFNKNSADRAAATTLQRGAIEAGTLRMRGSRVIATQRAGFGASGVDANTGTAAEVQAGTRTMSELDAKTALNNAARQAWGYKTSAFQYGQLASLDESASENSNFTTFLGSAGYLAGQSGGIADSSARSMNAQSYGGGQYGEGF